MIGNCKLKRVKTIKFLGLQMDEHLLWNVHVDFVRRKLSKYVHIIFKIRYFLNCVSMVGFYNTLIYPVLLYCNSVWGRCNSSLLNPLNVLQKRIIRLMFLNQVGNTRRHCLLLIKFLESIRLIVMLIVCSYIRICGWVMGNFLNIIRDQGLIDCP